MVTSVTVPLPLVKGAAFAASGMVAKDANSAPPTISLDLVL
jgi:hypothetical protein